MAVRPILTYPNPDLRRPAEAVTRFDAALADLAADLLETMQAAQGIGITAPHIGVFVRLAVIRLSPDEPARIYVNPRVVEVSEERASHKEGSVSMPDVLEEIDRPARVRVGFQTLTGEPQSEEAEDLSSVCLQHEIDQLDGIFWLDRLSRLRRERVIKRYEKIRRLTTG